MRNPLLIVFLVTLPFSVFADGPEFEIIGQKPLSTVQGQPITIQLTDLIIDDADDHGYPNGFRLQIYDNDNYLAFDDTVFPSPSFVGELEVVVRVRKGDDESRRHRITITVKPYADAGSKPVITGQRGLTVWMNSPITIELSDLIVSDGDNAYPDDFTLSVFEGTNYTLNEHTVTPASNFVGELTVAVSVNDGSQSSDPFDLKIQVVDNDGDLNPNAPLDIPSAFTPNNDNANDTWRIRQLRGFSEEYRRAIVKVYNRHGLLVYETRGFDKEWDGKYNGEVLPPDVYFYTIEVDITDPKKNPAGVVSILR
jgi:gliding motility-associated-like protein